MPLFQKESLNPKCLPYFLLILVLWLTKSENRHYPQIKWDKNLWGFFLCVCDLGKKCKLHQWWGSGSAPGKVILGRKLLGKCVGVIFEWWYVIYFYKSLLILFMQEKKVNWRRFFLMWQSEIKTPNVLKKIWMNISEPDFFPAIDIIATFTQSKIGLVKGMLTVRLYRLK